MKYKNVIKIKNVPVRYKLQTEKSRCICETLSMPPVATTFKKAFFSTKVKVKATSMHAKYEVSTSNGSKVIAKVKGTDKQTNKQTNRLQSVIQGLLLSLQNQFLLV